jgi:hypothetical protein
VLERAPFAERRVSRRRRSHAARAASTSLVTEIKAWERRRNRENPRIRWMFTVDRAREKLGKAYPIIAKRPVRKAAA